MRDTSPEVEERYRAMLMARSGEERLQMGDSMYATARALVVASVLERDRPASPAALRQALFLRFYGHEFDAAVRERILARLADPDREDPSEGRRSREVPVSWDDLEMALTWGSGELEHFLDLRTGQVRQYRPSAFSGDAEESDLSEDEADDRLAEGHLVRIEPLGSSREYGWMAEFAASVTNARLRDRLEIALGGRGAFRRFEDVLAGDPAERERWFRFRCAQVREAIREWLEEHGIEPKER